MTLRERTEATRSRGEKELVAFLTAGYPDEATFLRLVGAAAQAGCGVIEIGIPFSDPIADGPVIQRSSQQALAQGVTLARVIELAQEAAQMTSASLVFMSYLNPILQMGPERFATRAREAGVTGAILPDLSFEESAEMRGGLAACGVTLVDLIAPTSGPERVARIAAGADGFLYLVSMTGVTGSPADFSLGLEALLSRVRARTELPLYVGFGISDPVSAAQAARQADGIIVGSALIRLLELAGPRSDAVSRVGRFLREIKEAINSLPRSQP